MDLSEQKIEERTVAAENFVKKYWLAGVILLFAAAFAVIQFEQWQDRKMVERQTEKIQQYDSEREKYSEQTQMLQNIFDSQHQSTLKILDAMNSMSGTITKLTQNDLRQDKAVSEMRDTYRNAKNQQSKNNIAVRNARRALPVRRREADVIANDAELYPGAGN